MSISKSASDLTASLYVNAIFFSFQLPIVQIQDLLVAGFQRDVIAAMEKVNGIAFIRPIPLPKFLIKCIQHCIIFQPTLI